VRYDVDWSIEALAELERRRSYETPRIVAATAALAHEAETPTRNRKRLEGLPAPFPDPTWEVRIGESRVLYAVAGRKVTVLRVIVKGRRTTLESP
jgi:mRNA-degrading endonuclease RelE of RelBE toxin-antitoxin system